MDDVEILLEWLRFVICGDAMPGGPEIELRTRANTRLVVSRTDEARKLIAEFGEKLRALRP